MKKVLLGAVAMVASFGFGQAFAADSVTLQRPREQGRWSHEHGPPIVAHSRGATCSVPH